MAKRRPHFDAAYREIASLRDGTRVLVRVVRSEDRDLLREGFERLSARSRLLRFLGPKERLSDREIDELVTLDGVSRFALGARRILADGEEGEGLGIARFARRSDAPAVAEAAVTVVDEAQGRGLGSLLLARLTAAARERGIERFACEFDATNEQVWRLVKHVTPAAEVMEHGFVRAEVPLPPIRPDLSTDEIDRGSVAYELLAASARARPRARRSPGETRAERGEPAARRR